MEIKKYFLLIIIYFSIFPFLTEASGYFWYYGSVNDQPSGRKDCLFLARTFSTQDQCGSFLRANLSNTSGVCFGSRQICLDMSLPKYIYCDKVNGCQSTAKGVISLDQCSKEMGGKCYQIKDNLKCTEECRPEFYVFGKFTKECITLKYPTRKDCETENKNCYLTLQDCMNREFKKYTFCSHDKQPQCNIVPGKFINSIICERYLADNLSIQTSGKCYEDAGSCSVECSLGKKFFYGWDLLSECSPIGLFSSQESCRKSSSKGCYKTKDECIAKWGTKYYFYDKKSVGILGFSSGSCELTSRGYSFSWQCAQALKKFRKGQTGGICYEKLEDCQNDNQFPKKMFLCIKGTGCQVSDKEYGSFKECETMTKEGIEPSGDGVCYGSGMQCVAECNY